MKKFVKATSLILVILIPGYGSGHADLCDRVSEIKLLPFKGERVDDEAYNSLIDAGEVAIPCLIEKITDTRRMGDPRHAPTYPDVRVGDVAYFVLIEVTKLDFIEMLPAAVQKQYKNDGVYAYFRYVQRKQNREQLRRSLREWYRRK